MTANESASNTCNSHSQCISPTSNTSVCAWTVAEHVRPKLDIKAINPYNCLLQSDNLLFFCILPTIHPGVQLVFPAVGDIWAEVCKEFILGEKTHVTYDPFLFVLFLCRSLQIIGVLSFYLFIFPPRLIILH